MRFGRSATPKSNPVSLPGRGHTVTVVPSLGASLPARVLASAPEGLLVAIMVPSEPFTYKQLEGLVLEFTDSHGRVRLSGTASIDSPSEPDVLRIEHPRSVEVLQEREYVRIKSARPAVVYGGPDRIPVQSYTVDVSGGGFLLAGPDSLKIGDEVQFQLTLTPGVLLISGTGRVVRVDNQGRRGVEFESISELDRRRLIRFIFECQRSERQRGLDTDDRYGN
jgi:hypothetical protein